MPLVSLSSRDLVTADPNDPIAWENEYVLRLLRDGPSRRKALRLGENEEDRRLARTVLNHLQSYSDRFVRSRDSRLRRVLYLLRTICFNTNQLPPMLCIADEPGRGKLVANTPNGQVFLSTFNGVEVAKKRLSATSVVNDRKRFFREAIVWANMRHGHILPLAGIIVPSPTGDPVRDSNARLWMVSCWQENGTLRMFMQSNSYTPGSRVRLAEEIAIGIAYLHGQKVVHGDIKDGNILIGPKHEARISDFGLVMVGDVTTGAFTTTATRGSTLWEAPERLSAVDPAVRQRRTTEIDVYAYGCICFMLCTGHAVFEGLPDSNTRILAGQRPRVPPNSVDGTAVDPSFERLIGKCWHQQPGNRPTIIGAMMSFGISTELALGDGALFYAKAIRDYLPVPETYPSISFKAGELLEIYNASQESVSWQALAPSGSFGTFPNDTNNPYVQLPVMFRAQVKHAFIPSPERRHRVGYQTLDHVVDDWVEVIHLWGEKKWLVRRCAYPHEIGFVAIKMLEPEWPVSMKVPGHCKTTKAHFDYNIDYPNHLPVRAGQYVTIRFNHESDTWCLGMTSESHRGPFTLGVVPKYILE